MKCDCGCEFEPEIKYRHRLMCGDSTSAEDVGWLMDGERARAVITDPPWNVGWDYGEYQDDLTIEEYKVFTDNWYNNILDTLEDAYCFVAQSMRNYKHISYWFPQAERLFAECQNFVQHTPESMQYAFNPIAVWRIGEPKIKPMAGRRDWFIAETSNTKMTDDKLLAKLNTATRWLPTFVYIVENWTSRNDVIYDPFLGSGTTMVSCEMLGRICRGMEISPAYCSVVLERMSNMGLKPRLTNSVSG